MSATDKEIRDQQQLRRQRVNRIKNGIILTITLWMLFSLLAIIILSVQVIRLSFAVNRLKIDTVLESENSESVDTTEALQIDDTDIIKGIDSPENMATEGDLHQVYLTFNCNPSSNTEEILDVLSLYNVKATFFVTGNPDEAIQPIYQRIVAEGHTLGMHSYSNQYSTIYASTDAFLEDYEKISDYLYDITGVRSVYYRFPGGSGNEISNVNMAELVNALNQEEITYYDWNVTAGDAAADYTVDDVVWNVAVGVSKYKTSVVLLHDDENKSTTAEALGPLIQQLQNMQAEILPIDENTNVIQYIKADSVG